MTIAEALAKVDKLRPNRFDRAQKVNWIANLESQIYNEIVCTHENPMRIPYPHIDNNTDPDRVLIAPFPYDEVYTSWVQCQIDLHNMEIGKYNNDRTIFNNAMMTLRDYWTRRYMPLEQARYLNFDERIHPHYDWQPLMSNCNPLDIPNGYVHKPMDPKRKIVKAIEDIRKTDLRQDEAIDTLEEVTVKDMNALTGADVEEIING